MLATHAYANASLLGAACAAVGTLQMAAAVKPLWRAILSSYWGIAAELLVGLCSANMCVTKLVTPDSHIGIVVVLQQVEERACCLAWTPKPICVA
jgi:hypothetical protein